jgi:hypothetical protein
MKPTEAVVFYVRRKATHRETGETSLTSFGPFVIYEDAQMVQQQDEGAPREPGYEYEYSIETVPIEFPPPPH